MLRNKSKARGVQNDATAPATEVAVIGGSGYLGGKVVKALVAQGNTVRSLDIAEPKEPVRHCCVYIPHPFSVRPFRIRTAPRDSGDAAACLFVLLPNVNLLKHTQTYTVYFYFCV